MAGSEQYGDVWQFLAADPRPIIVYGMGDGAEKLIARLADIGRRPAAVFASDDFARGAEFLGFRVGTLDDALGKTGGDVIIAVAFATCLADVMARIRALSRRYTLVVPDMPPFGEGLFTEEYAAAHEKELHSARALFADDESRRVFDALLKFRLFGDISALDGTESVPAEAAALLRLPAEPCYIDLGAYDGDTALVFAAEHPRYRRIWAVEPDRKNFKKLLKNTAGMRDVRAVFAAAGEKDGEAVIAVTGSRNSSLAAPGTRRAETVPAVSVDTLAAKAQVDLIKLDVEGAEREALLGAKKTIKRCAPALMAAAYHRVDDIFALPLLIKKLRSDYDIYLRRFPYYPAWDVFLYCVRRSEAAFVYLLLCADGTLYCGWTNDLHKRLAAHNAAKGAKYTRSRLPVRLVYAERAANRNEALSREREIKALPREKKLALAESFRKASGADAFML